MKFYDYLLFMTLSLLPSKAKNIHSITSHQSVLLTRTRKTNTIKVIIIINVIESSSSSTSSPSSSWSLCCIRSFLFFLTLWCDDDRKSLLFILQLQPNVYRYFVWNEWNERILEKKEWGWSIRMVTMVKQITFE